jgi:hypothetical protein
MSVETAGAIADALLAYAALGVLFAIPFAWRGVQRIDPAAAGATLGFRLAILPGAAALWPYLAWRWLRGRQRPPLPRDAHRRAAAEQA